MLMPSHIKEVAMEAIPNVTSSMIKHPYQKTPASVNFYARRIGKRKNPMFFVLD
jgi:hypothetical protein